MLKNLLSRKIEELIGSILVTIMNNQDIIICFFVNITKTNNSIVSFDAFHLNIIINWLFICDFSDNQINRPIVYAWKINIYS